MTILGFTSRPTNIGAQKTNDSSLKTYSIVLVGFSIQNSLEKMQFFKKTFLLIKINIEIVLRMFFFLVI